MANPTPNPAATTTTFQVGTYNATNDSFTSKLDLNDGATFFILNGSLQLPQPPKVAVSSFNVRTPGEQVVRYQYKNRHIKVSLTIRGASTSALLGSVRSLLAAVEQPPYTIRMSLPGATAYTYADVRYVTHNIPADPLRILQKAIVKVEIDFTCAPFFRGDRLTLQNLVVNPGFEGPIGGSQAPAVVAFQDTFANVNAYAVQAGGAPTTGPAKTYVDIVLGDAPLLFWPMSEASTPTPAYDIAGQGKSATAGGSGTTIGAAGGISGDTSTAWSFNGSGYATFPAATTTALPTGNGAWTIEAWVKFAANPGALAVVASFGAQATGHGGPQIYINTSGQPAASNDVGPDAVGTALSLNTWHHVAATWDGTNMRVWQDGTNSASTTPGAAAIPNPPTYGTIAGSAAAAPAMLFTGSVQMVAIYGTALSAAQITAHYNAGHTGATGTVANAMSIPSAGRAAFGSPAWGPMQTWQTRFRWVTGLTASFYLHYTDANNHLRCDVASGTNALKLVHTVAGAATTVAQASPTLIHEGWYWLQVTQFPTVPGNPPYLTATLSYDSGGAVGAQIAQIAGAASDAVTAEVGRPQLATSGAALAMGGLASGAGHQVSLFGPGGWTFNGTGAAGPCSGAWDGASSLAGTSANGAGNTYPSGPVTSFGCARIDLAPAGAVDAKWRLYTGGAPAGTWAMPVAAGGDVVLLSAYAKSSGLGVAATIKLEATEYTASGVSLGTTVLQTLTSNQGAWTQLAGSLTTQATTAYLDLAVHVADTNAGASANGTVWVDNCQCWDQTACNGQASMPYCELRFPNSPAQLMVSGLAGDVAANAWVGFGTYLTNWAPNSQLNFALGRRAIASASAQLVGPSCGFYGTAFSPQSTAALDGGSLGGYYPTATVTGSGWNPRAFSPHSADVLGSYHLVQRFLTKQSVGNLGNVNVRFATVEQGSAWYGKSDFSDYWATTYGTNYTPLTASNAWQVVDMGQLTLPPFPHGGVADLTQNYLTPRPQWGDSTGGGSVNQAGWQALMPFDGGLLFGQVVNAQNGVITVTNQWLWTYSDPLGAPGSVARPSVPFAWNNSIEASSLPNPARGFGGFGTTTTGYIAANPSADPFMTLDPEQLVGATVVNQFAGYVADGNATVLPLHVEMQYSPLYLYPR